MTGDTLAARATPGDRDSRARRRARDTKLRSSRDIRAVFASRRAVSSEVAVVHALVRGDDSPPRATVVAGRKVGSAVQRNRVKRRLRAVVADLDLPPGVDYVVVGRAAARTAPAPRLRDEVARQVQAVTRT